MEPITRRFGPGTKTICQQVADAIRALHEDTHNMVEGAGAIGLAAVIKEKNAVAGRKVGIVLSGANIARPPLAEILTGKKFPSFV